MKPYIILVLLVVSSIGFCQEKTFNQEDVSITKWIDGTLLNPNTAKNPSLAILIGVLGLQTGMVIKIF